MSDTEHPSNASGETQVSSFAELEQIFLQVADVPTNQQEALLNKLAPDESLRQQIRDLLTADSTDNPLLDHSLIPEPLDVRVGEHIADYELVKELGRGGMGVVFMANQLEPVRRKVALKVIKPGVDTREVIARFDAERQALSMMDHPNIAKVLDAGTTENGRPFFVMELVTGEPITTYCDQNQLPVKERLELFLSVCHAIQHAHQKGIIHRDIKPSNVLVAEYDGRPVPKVIDFGIAKAINQPLTEVSVFTGFGQIIGTFEYMSPEQSRVNQVDVDTRSDIYSLGVLLYELLTGNTPFDRDRLRSVAWEEMLRIIRDEDPPKPSKRLSEINRPASREGANSHEPAKLSRTLRGELDWIIMKALEKDRNRRYETPNQLASDIECFLNGDAVAACPPSAMYLFRKFARRNRAAIATTTFVAAALILGLVGTTWQAFRATTAEMEAEANAREAKAVNEFLIDDLLGLASAETQLSAGLQPDPNLKLETLLNRALARVEKRFDDLPHVEASLKAKLASSLFSIGRFNDATPFYEHYFNYLEKTKGLEHPDTIRVMRQLSIVYMEQSLLFEAESICKTALYHSRNGKTENDKVTIQLLNDLGILYQKQGEYEKAKHAYLECLDSELLKGKRHPDRLIIKSNLAVLYEKLNRFGVALELHHEVLKIQLDAIPRDHRRVANAMSNLGTCYMNRGRQYKDYEQFDIAAPLLKESSEIYNLADMSYHPDALETQWNLSQVYSEVGNHAAAQTILPRLLERFTDLHGPDHQTTLEAMNLLGWTYMHLNRLAEAENVLSETLDIHNRLDQKTHGMLQVMGNLAIVYYRMGKLEKSTQLETKTLEIAREVLEKDHIETLSSTARLGLIYLETNRSEKGRTLLESVFNAAPTLPGTFQIGGILATSYLREGRIEEAVEWTNRQVATGRSNLPENSFALAEVLAESGVRMLKMGKWSEAEELLRENFSIQKKLNPDTWDYFDAQSMLGEAVCGQQNFDLAETLLIEAHNGLSAVAAENSSPAINMKRIRAVERLIALYKKTDKPERLREWKQKKGNLEAFSP